MQTHPRQILVWQTWIFISHMGVFPYFFSLFKTNSLSLMVKWSYLSVCINQHKLYWTPASSWCRHRQTLFFFFFFISIRSMWMKEITILSLNGWRIGGDLFSLQNTCKTLPRHSQVPCICLTLMREMVWPCMKQKDFVREEITRTVFSEEQTYCWKRLYL